MTKNSYAPLFSDLPGSLPIFPLTGALLLPGGNLPLNIFEPRYLAMVDAAMAGNRLIGMIQPREKGGETLYDIGCAGKIIEFSEEEDGRYMISLRGICRFQLAQELEVSSAFRQVRPDWSAYEGDLSLKSCLGLDREKLEGLLKAYFEMEGLSCDWGRVDEASDGKLITCLSMICPFDPKEKQALLEADACQARAALFMDLLDFALKGGSPGLRDAKTRH